MSAHAGTINFTWGEKAYFVPMSMAWHGILFCVEKERRENVNDRS